MGPHPDLAKPKETAERARSPHGQDAETPQRALGSSLASLLPPMPPRPPEVGRPGTPPPDLLGRLPSPLLRQSMILQMQRVQGNRYVERMIVGQAQALPPTPAATEETVASDDRGRPHRAVQRLAEPAAGVGSVPWYAATAESGPTVQREEEAGGLFAWVTEGWESLQAQATGLVGGLRETASGGFEALSAAAEGVTGQVSGAWEGLQSGAAALVRMAEERGLGQLAGILNQLGAVGAALLGLDAGRLGAAWAALTGAAGAAWNVVKTLAAGVVSQLGSQWDQAQGLAAQVLGDLGARAADLIGGLASAAGSVQAQLGGLWESLTGSVAGLLSQIPGWSAIEAGWSALMGEVQATIGEVIGEAQSAWQGIQARADSAWNVVETAWAGLREWVREQAGAVAIGFETVVGALRVSAIDQLVETITKVSGFFEAIKQAIQNPDAVIDPIAQAITAKLANLPEQVRTEAQAKIPQAAGSGGGGGDQTATMGPGSGGGAAASAATAGPAVMRTADQGIQREARGTLGIGEIIAGAWNHLGAKTSALKANMGEEVKKTLLSLVWPPATWAGLTEDWAHMTQELSARWERGSGIRTDSLTNAFEDLRRFCSNLLDFPLIIWRSVNAMLGRFSVYFTLLLMGIGAIGGAAGSGVIGALAGFLLGGGWGAIPGTAGGGLAGAGAGALAGLASAATLGLVLLSSFLVAEWESIVKAVLDLLLVPQSADEQDEDLDQTANSFVGMVAAGILAGLSWVAVQVGRLLITLVRAVRGRLRGAPREIPDAERPGGPVEAVPGKLPLIERIGTVLDRVRALRERIDRLPPDAQPALRARQEALEQRLAHLREQARAADTPEQIAELGRAVDAAERQSRQLERAVVEAQPPAEVPGKASLLDRVGAAADRARTLRERVANLTGNDRRTLQPELDAAEQRIAQLDQRARAAETPDAVERIAKELDAVEEQLAAIERNPLLELGLRGQALDAIESMENIKRDPVGEVNQIGNHNHYHAARREAAGDIVARRPDGRPYSHIGDLQRAYDGLQNVRRALEREANNPPASMTNRGLDVLVNKGQEVQAMLSRRRAS